MRRGFKYDTSLCVACNACSAACILENGLQPGTRTIYSWNRHACPQYSVINLSLACNHCLKPACLEGCPAKAYTINTNGIVMHHAERCMGCSYCTWRCPYDSPKKNKAKGYIEKCHFCYERAEDSVDPACVTACPTGAIKLVYEDEFEGNDLSWFPDSGLSPSVKIVTDRNMRKPVIVPSEGESHEINVPETANRLRKEWSLILFSLLVIASAVILITSFLTGTKGRESLAGSTLVAAVLLSFVHLGVKKAAWRSVLNILHSPLSREVAGVGILTLLCLSVSIWPGWLPPLVTCIIALIVLILVDLVYLAADKNMSLRLHSGQAFFSGIFAVSFYSNSLNAFIIFTLLAAASVVLRYNTLNKTGSVRDLYYYRALALPLALILMWFGNDWLRSAAGIVMITGIIADRLLFFEDFRPENIKDKISDQFNTEYEKERDKQPQDAYIP